MDYEKVYKEALERARERYEKVPDSILGLNLVGIFPELAESEDDKIGKDIIRILKGELRYTSKENIDKYIAWLEKQKDTNVLIQEASEKAYTEGMRVETKHWLEKQGESNLIEEIKRRKELFLQEKEKAVSSSEKLSLGGRIAMLEELLVFANEKQDEQKPILDFKASNWYVSKVDGKIHDMTYNPTDKMEPKFKTGEWVVNRFGDVWHIDSFDKKNYQVSNGDKYCYFPIEKQNEMHLWTIQDAKDGDVLYHSDTASNGIFIFKELLEYEFGKKVICYCDYDSEDGFCLGESHTCCWTDAKILHPATKEQCNTLFAKMKEAGYEWDAEKKELKKVEQKPAWSEEDEYMLNETIQHLEELIRIDKAKHLGCDVQYYQRDIDWLKSIKERIHPKSQLTDESVTKTKEE